MADTLRFYYPAYCDFCDKLCKPASIDYKNHPELRAVWLEWKSKHNALIPEYDKIKVDPLLNRFYRSADSKDFGVLLETE